MIQELQTGILDINNKYTVDFSCKQLDDIILKIIVYDKSLPADLSDYNVRLKAFKADQVPLIQNTNISIKDNSVTIKASKQLTTTQGIVKAELQFINKTTLEKKSTFYINIEVVASVLDVEGTVSTPTCTILEEIDHKLDQIENIGEVLDEAKEVRDTLTNKTIPTATNINSKLET
ncbi:viral A-type inclusion protein, partial [Clostridium botulinum]|nr:viral A-type inclusion protein [Clostridium botulinum]NFT37364.1 viral A-type inclusion protein [Clostridium botulinum]NFU33742.1 viral A-type inclusion protein [Clostridium botulinum]NHL29914.1 viral A-type inclusion protein [Clostridium botulinum]